MKRVKGCLNSCCTEHKKKYYKESDEYCVKCGSKLGYVCKHSKCFKQLPDNTKEKYCPIHLAERKDKKEKTGDAIKKIGGTIVAVGVTAAGIGKAVFDIIKKD